ncbi:hypothetical protein L3X38_004494 [Prunus dulcis]|uniref:Uncharacterized protein n=1 Tax=Prunus dulcis TaxID=3755 RepID=A0AAD5F3C0_PRUDU|nr:hypothetical protein L3X38_004494 [Prunus dulcis]
MVKSLGFPCYEIVDATRFSGGLWLLWKNDKVSIDVLGITDQTITVCVHGVWGWCKSIQFMHFMKTTAGGNHGRVEGTWRPRFGAQLKGTSQPRECGRGSMDGAQGDGAEFSWNCGRALNRRAASETGQRDAAGHGQRGYGMLEGGQNHWRI